MYKYNVDALSTLVLTLKLDSKFQLVNIVLGLAKHTINRFAIDDNVSLVILLYIRENTWQQ